MTTEIHYNSNTASPAMKAAKDKVKKAVADLCGSEAVAGSTLHYYLHKLKRNIRSPRLNSPSVTITFLKGSVTEEELAKVAETLNKSGTFTHNEQVFPYTVTQPAEHKLCVVFLDEEGNIPEGLFDTQEELVAH